MHSWNLPRRIRAGCSFTGAVLAAAFAPNALAAAAAPSQVADEPAELAEVVVYARRRIERPTDVPLAVTSRSGAALRERSALLLDDLGRDIPNVRMVSSPQSVSALDVTMRGQTVNRSAIVFDPAVGLYVDGVYVANGQAAMATLLDVDSVEVVRGSQGTLFGRNNTGGSISLRTRRPDPHVTSFEVSGAGGNRHLFQGSAIVNLPVSEDFALRLAYQNNSRRGFGSNPDTGQDNLQNQHRYQARIGALWTPGDATSAYFTYERFEANENGAILHPLAGPAPGTFVAQIGAALSQFPIPGLPTVNFPDDPHQAAGNFHSLDHARYDALHLEFEQRFSQALAAKLILGYRKLKSTTALDVDASELPLADSTLFNTSRQRSAELQLSGKALSDRLDWVGGLYWFRDTGGAPSVQSAASPDFLAALDAVAQASGGQVDLRSFFSPYDVHDDNSVTNRSAAAFAHAEYHITPDWAVAAGVRRTEDKRELDENSYVVIPGLGQSCTILDFSAPPPFRIQGPCPPVHKSVSYGFWSWEFSSHYRVNEALNVYARIGRSQRSGGWNAPLNSIQDTPFRPERLTDYELGFKSVLAGGAVRINGDVFYGRYNDMQRLLARLNPDGTPVTLVTNAGRARVSGAELEAQIRPSRRTAIEASVGYTDAHYLTFLYAPVEGGPVLDLSSNAFYQTPRVQASLGATYAVPTPAGSLSLHADYAWQDKIQFNVINDFNYQRSYGTANARIALDDPAHRWVIALYARNLTNKRYAYNGGTLGAPFAPTPTIAWNIPGERRTVAIEGTYRWEIAR